MGLVGRAASFGKAALSKLTSFEAVVKPREIESDISSLNRKIQYFVDHNLSLLSITTL